MDFTQSPIIPICVWVTIETLNKLEATKTALNEGLASLNPSIGPWPAGV